MADHTDRAYNAIVDAAHSEPDFAEWLTRVVASVVADRGGVDALLAGHPGSWQSSAVQAWMESAGVGMPEILDSYRRG